MTKPAAEAVEFIAGWLGGYYEHSHEEAAEQAAMDLLEALKAARIELIQLPEPTYVDDDGQVFYGEYDVRADPTGSPQYRTVTTDFGLGGEVKRSMPPSAARYWAGVLLAAAVSAEGRAEQ